MTIAIRLLLLLAAGYIAVGALLFVFQSRSIYPAPQARPELTPGYEEVVLETSDGLALRAFHREAEGDLPTILYLHGNGGTLAGASVSNAAPAQAGFGVLLVEYRGYGGNPGEPSEAGFALDAEAALRWLAARGVKPSRTVVIGNSIGGGVATGAALAMVEAGEPPAALVLIAPFTSLPDVASEKLWWLPVRLLVSERYHNEARIARLGEVPVLIQHGSADTLIADHHGRKLARASRHATFQGFEGSGHDLSFEPRSQKARAEWLLEREGR